MRGCADSLYRTVVTRLFPETHLRNLEQLMTHVARLKCSPVPFALLMLLSFTPVTHAQTAPGVTDKEILIGSCAALEGPSSFLGRGTVNGAEAYFQAVNEEGGVNGRKLRLVSFDD